MKAGVVTSFTSEFEKILLHWADSNGLAAKQEQVQLVAQNASESIVHSQVEIQENTHVYLTGSSYTGNGIVKSCRTEGRGYLLTVAMCTETSFFLPRQEFDPGVLDVDSFLTEADEAKILGNLEGETSRTAEVSRCLSRIIAALCRLAGSCYYFPDRLLRDF